MGHQAIIIEQLGKKYQIGALSASYATLRETLYDACQAPFRRLKAVLAGQDLLASKESIWALKDISLKVKQGEALGIIGRNGAGKSTLLKILSRVTKPTTGSARLYGRVGSLLEVGTGFHPELTGRDNIYLNGAIMGMKKAEITRKFDEIVAFSGVEKFIDTPVKRFSSGMYTRLAFAVAAYLEPEIFIVDEVLAVGDMAFQNQCLGKMSDIASGGRTILFVSHNMAAISSLCPKAILLDKGEIKFVGESSQVVARYAGLMRSHEMEDLEHRKDRIGNGLLKITRILLEDPQGNICQVARCGAEIRFVLEYVTESTAPQNDVAVHLVVADGARYRLFSFLSEISGDFLQNLPPQGRLVCSVGELPLLPGTYDLHFTCLVGRQLTDKMLYARHLVVADGDFYGTDRLYTDSEFYGKILVHHKWSVEGQNPAN